MSLHPSRPRRTALTNVAAVALLLSSLTACGGYEEAGAEPTATSAAKKATEKPAADKDAVSAADLCDFLEKKLPEWKSIGSEIGAMARLTTDITVFYEDHGLTPAGVDLDDKTQAECPDVRTKVLEAGGLESFRTL